MGARPARAARRHGAQPGDPRRRTTSWRPRTRCSSSGCRIPGRSTSPLAAAADARAAARAQAALRSWGRDVVLCTTDAELDAALARARLGSGSTPPAESSRARAPTGFDLGCIVAADRVVGAAMRVAAENEWRTNVALGASGGRRAAAGRDEPRLAAARRRRRPDRRRPAAHRRRVDDPRAERRRRPPARTRSTATYSPQCALRSSRRPCPTRPSRRGPDLRTGAADACARAGRSRRRAPREPAAARRRRLR